MVNVSGLLSRANEQIMQADTRAKLLELLKTYESIVEADPANFEALWSLGRYHIVMVLGYTENLTEKKNHNLAAIHCCERAMNTNPEFRRLTAHGENVWDACRALSRREMAPLYYWYSGTGSYWKECLSFPGKMQKIHLAAAIRKVMTRMLAIDPAWAGGHPYYAWGFYHATVPRIFGGDLRKAETFFSKAVEAGPNWLYVRWGRAKYLHTRKKDRDAFLRDLEWVVSQDPRACDSPYPANVFFQKDARNMLAHAGAYF